MAHVISQLDHNFLKLAFLGVGASLLGRLGVHAAPISILTFDLGGSGLKVSHLKVHRNADLQLQGSDTGLELEFALPGSEYETSLGYFPIDTPADAFFQEKMRKVMGLWGLDGSSDNEYEMRLMGVLGANSVYNWKLYGPEMDAAKQMLGEKKNQILGQELWKVLGMKDPEGSLGKYHLVGSWTDTEGHRAANFLRAAREDPALLRETLARGAVASLAMGTGLAWVWNGSDDTEQEAKTLATALSWVEPGETKSEKLLSEIQVKLPFNISYHDQPPGKKMWFDNKDLSWAWMVLGGGVRDMVELTSSGKKLNDDPDSLASMWRHFFRLQMGRALQDGDVLKPSHIVISGGQEEKSGGLISKAAVEAFRDAEALKDIGVLSGFPGAAHVGAAVLILQAKNLKVVCLKGLMPCAVSRGAHYTLNE